MKKSIIKALSVVLVVVLTLTSAPLSGFVGLDLPGWLDFSIKSSAATSGICGENLIWSFDDTTGTLNISGVGEMYDNDYENSLWGIDEYDIEKVVIENGVTSIGKSAFASCYYLTEVTIPDSVISIGVRAFINCANLTRVQIPDSVTSIGSLSFGSCYRLTSITVDKNNQYYSSDEYGVLFNKDKTTLIRYPCGSTQTDYTIPDSVTRIDDSAFEQCSIINVTVPNSVIEIGINAFSACTYLSNIKIGNGVTTIGISAFLGCVSLTELVIPNSVKTIGGYAFSNCYNLTKISMSDSIEKIDEGLFYWCESLTTVKIPDNVSSIDGLAFAGCVNITNVAIPRCINSIGEGAFALCSSLNNVYYSGTQYEWDLIAIHESNDSLLNATIHCNSSLHDICNENGHTAAEPVEECVVMPTCVSEGSYDVVVYCQRCGEELSRITYTIVLTEHNYVNGICTYCNFNVNNENTYQDYENVTVNYKDKGSITLNFKQEWFKKDSSYYNHDIATLCSQFITLGYDDKNLEGHLETIGFKNVFWETNAHEDQVDNFIASREINVNGLKFTLLFVGCIGTNTVQWYSNFKPGTGETHESFNKAKTYVYNNLKKYIEENNIDTSKTKILICGHSRGAATANLLAAQLIDEEKFATKAHIHTYTFATPNPTSSTKAKDSKYSRIFNIVNPEDFVTKVLPAQWKYRRYGTTYVLPSKTNTSNYKNLKSNMQYYFRKLTGEKYTPFKNGEQETYKIVNKFTSTVKSVNDFYNKGMRGSIVDNDMKPYEFFQNCICPLVGSEVGSEDFINGLVAFIDVLIDPTTCRTYKKFAQYFFENAVLDRLNTMTPDSLKIVLPIIQPVLGSTISTVLATSEGYFEDSHRAETYCAYMMSMSSSQLTTYKKSYKNTVNCPVDVEVYDKATGELVGRIIKNVIDEEIAAKENSIVMDVEGDSKSFWLPSDGEYDVRLIGNDNGTMDYTVAEVDGDSVETTRVNFVGVQITDNKSMSGAFSGEEFVLEDYSLTTEDGEIIESDDIINLDNIDEYEFDVTISTSGIGFATGDGTFTKGDYVTVTASTDELNEFLGWYENGELVSTDVEYGFVVQNDVELIAKFTDNVPEPEYNYTFSIQTPSRTEIRNKDGIILHAQVDGTAPNGSYVKWESSNGNFDEDANGYDLEIIAKNKGYTTFTAILCAEDGTELARSSVEMYSKSGFFDKIGGFFRSLFGTTKIYEN